MRRFTAHVVAFSAVIIGSVVPHVIAEDYVCPPGAKFCPVPGAGVASAQAPAAASFGLAPSPNDQLAVFQSQLNEGERLIMVAPSGAPAPMRPRAAPMAAQPQTYVAAAPASGGMPLDFIPPPPGAPRSPAPSVSPAPAARMQPHESPRTFQTASVPEPAERHLAAAPVRREPARPNVPAAREPARPSLAVAPDSFGRRERPAGSDDAPPARRQPQAAQKPPRKRRADMLSEVANETSRKNPKSGSMKTSGRDKDKKSPARKDAKKDNKKEKREKKERTGDDRVPWWKGGLWRNRGK